MTKYQIAKMLKDDGYRLVRRGRKHEIWAKGELTIPVSQGSKTASRTLTSLKVQIRQRELTLSEKVGVHVEKASFKEDKTIKPETTSNRRVMGVWGVTGTHWS